MKVLFVCFGNAYRSPLAESLLKKLRPDLEVDSAGLHVAIPISMEVKEYLKRHNAAQYLKAYPESIGEKNLRSYDVIVTMDQYVKDAILKRCPDCVDRIVGGSSASSSSSGSASSAVASSSSFSAHSTCSSISFQTHLSVFLSLCQARGLAYFVAAMPKKPN
jgi:protein-tyrosine-phosphatase